MGNFLAISLACILYLWALGYLFGQEQFVFAIIWFFAGVPISAFAAFWIVSMLGFDMRSSRSDDPLEERCYREPDGVFCYW